MVGFSYAIRASPGDCIAAPKQYDIPTVTASRAPEGRVASPLASKRVAQWQISSVLVARQIFDVKAETPIDTSRAQLAHASQASTRLLPSNVLPLGPRPSWRRTTMPRLPDFSAGDWLVRAPRQSAFRVDVIESPRNEYRQGALFQNPIEFRRWYGALSWHSACSGRERGRSLIRSEQFTHFTLLGESQ